MKNKLIWKSEEEMQKELQERINSWKQGLSKDGYVLHAKGEFNYKEIKYLIKVLRYYDHTNRFTSIGSRISNSHVVVEYPEETKPIVDLVYGIEGVYDFLYHDTLHSYNNNQTTEEQIEVCHRLAKEDINSLFNGEISDKLDEAIKKLRELKDKLEKILEKDK